MEIDIDDFLDDLIYIDPQYKPDIANIESKYKCFVECSTEKINSLQFTHYFEIDFGLEENFFVEMESGINNGTQINSAEWGISTLPDYRTVEVIADIVLDDSYYINDFQRRKAQAVLDSRKSEIFEYIRKNNYDNYVTGGHSKLKLDPLLAELKLDYIYKEVKADVNFM